MRRFNHSARLNLPTFILGSDFAPKYESTTDETRMTEAILSSVFLCG